MRHRARASDCGTRPAPVVVLTLSATIVWAKAGLLGGINLAPFDPMRATQGVAGFWAAVILAMLAFSGFDVVATAAEEAQAPRDHVPRVLILAVVGIGVFWALNAWVLTLSTPPSEIAKYNVEGLTAITPVARAYWGSADIIVIATAFTGLTAIYIGCVQGASRIIFALARHRLLPAPFARLKGEKRVPRAAVLFVVLICIVMGSQALRFCAMGWTVSSGGRMRSCSSQRSPLRASTSPIFSTSGASCLLISESCGTCWCPPSALC